MLRVVLCLVVVGFRTFVEWRECDCFRQVGTRVGTRVARECGEFVAHDIGGEFIGRRQKRGIDVECDRWCRVA